MTSQEIKDKAQGIVDTLPLEEIPKVLLRVQIETAMIDANYQGWKEGFGKAIKIHRS